MKKKTATDPILIAHAATNKGNAHRKVKFAYYRHWRDLDEQAWQRKFFKQHWQPAVKECRRRFRAEFRAKAWEDLRITWDGLGYTHNGITKKVELYLSYIAYWKGFEIRKSFHAECIEDVIAETWKLGGLLAGEPFPDRSKE